MIRCYIVDDELHAIKVLQLFIEQTPGLVLTGSWQDPLLALQEIQSDPGKCDVIFLDVDMEQLSGIQFAELVKGQVKVIITTAHENFALKAFDSNAVDFLLKPISYERFLVAVGKLLETEPKKPVKDVIFLQPENNGKIYRLVRNDILFIEAFRHYVKLYMANENYMVRMNISEVERALASPDFQRIHKSFIVNVNQIKSIEGNMITVNNNYVLGIGPKYRSDFLQYVNSSMFGAR